MKKVKHWLHILLAVLTSGLWLLPYVAILACTEQHNRGYRAGKAAGRVERQNEIDEERAKPKFVWSHAPGSCTVNGFSVAQPIVEQQDGVAAAVLREYAEVALPVQVIRAQPKSRLDRFSELADRNRQVGLDEYERAEYFQLRAELSR